MLLTVAIVGFVCVALGVSEQREVGGRERDRAEKERDDEPKRSEKRKEEELLFVHSVYRHGLISQQYDFSHPWLLGLRIPQPEGLVQLFRLGQAMKRRYIDELPFLNPKNAYAEVFTHSIEYDRSIEGASAKSAGMFPIKEASVLEKQKGGEWPSNWMPMPIHMLPLGEDINLSMDINCSIYLDFLNDKMSTYPEYNETITEHQWLFELLSRKLNTTVNPENIGLIEEAINPKKNDGDHRLKWVTPGLLEKTIYLSKVQLLYKMIDPKIVRMRGGPLISEMLQRMEAKWNLTQDRSEKSYNSTNILNWQKYYGYSCRGMPIMWQLSVLGQENYTDNTVPPYASNLIYELWNQGGKPYVSVFYYDGDTEKISPVRPLNCPKPPERCPLNTFRESVAQYLIEDRAGWWVNECGRPKPTKTPTLSPVVPITSLVRGRYRSLAVIFAIIIVVLTMFVVVQLCMLIRSKKQQRYENLSGRTLLVSSDIK